MALVGPSGAGKSTALALIPRLHDATWAGGPDRRGGCARRDAGQPARRHRLCRPGRAAVRRHAWRRISAMGRPGREPRRRSRRRRGRRRRRFHRRPARGLRHRGRPARAAAFRRAAPAGGAGAGPCCATRACCCSTRRPARWTPRARRRCRRRWRGCARGARPSWWRTGSPPCATPTSWSRMADGRGGGAGHARRAASAEDGPARGSCAPRRWRIRPMAAFPQPAGRAWVRLPSARRLDLIAPNAVRLRPRRTWPSAWRGPYRCGQGVRCGRGAAVGERGTRLAVLEMRRRPGAAEHGAAVRELLQRQPTRVCRISTASCRSNRSSGRVSAELTRRLSVGDARPLGLPPWSAAESAAQGGGRGRGGGRGGVRGGLDPQGSARDAGHPRARSSRTTRWWRATAARRGGPGRRKRRRSVFWPSWSGLSFAAR